MSTGKVRENVMQENNFGFRQEVNTRNPTIRITKLLLIETGTYNHQYRRPYFASISNSSVMELSERLSHSDGLNTNVIANMAPDFVKIQAAPESQIIIPNDWATPRLRFHMEVVIDTGLGTIVENVQGYSEEQGLSLQGSINPNMMFYINSVTKSRKHFENVPGMGRIEYNNVVGSAHLLANNDYSTPYDNNVSRIRPMDVFQSMKRSHLIGVDSFIDDSVAHNHNTVMSRRSNNIPTNYMASIISAYASTNLQNSIEADFNPTEGNTYDVASSHVEEDMLVRDYFLRTLSQIQGKPSTNMFTFRDLVTIDSGVPSVTAVNRRGETTRTSFSNHQVGSTAYWNTADNTTVAATALSNALPALMMELGLTGIVFKSTNRTIGCQPHTEIINVESFSNIDLSKIMQVFVMRLEREIINYLTDRNMVDYAIEMRVDLLGETWASVSFNNEPFTDFVTPSFADALLVPVLTANRQLVNTMACDFDALLSTVVPTHSQFCNVEVNFQETNMMSKSQFSSTGVKSMFDIQQNDTSIFGSQSDAPSMSLFDH